jgi:hypothetical protein
MLVPIMILLVAIVLSGCAQAPVKDTVMESLYLDCEASIDAYEAMGDRLEDEVVRVSGELDVARESLRACEATHLRYLRKSAR